MQQVCYLVGIIDKTCEVGLLSCRHYRQDLCSRSVILCWCILDKTCAAGLLSRRHYRQDLCSRSVIL